MPPEPTTPEVATYVQRAGDGVWDLTVVCCFCNDRHQHGGGSGTTPALGPRRSHCIRDDRRATYLLVTGPTDMVEPAAQPQSWRCRQWRTAHDQEAGRDVA